MINNNQDNNNNSKNCIINKEKKNCCQFCWFKKCLETGMILKAIREDRMPKGRNASTIYNLYQMKYRKTKKISKLSLSLKTTSSNLGNNTTKSFSPHLLQPSTSTTIICNSSNFTNNIYYKKNFINSDQCYQSYIDEMSKNNKFLLKTETNQNHLEKIKKGSQDACKQMYISPPSSPINMLHDNYANHVKCVISPQHCDFSNSTPIRKNLIQKLIDIDQLDNLINLQGLQLRSEEQRLLEKTNAVQRLSLIGDEIVEHLVEWTKMLPFYNDLPVEVLTHLLTQRWAELVLLSTCFFAYTVNNCLNSHIELIDSSYSTTELKQHKNIFNLLEEVSYTDVNNNLKLLQRRLSYVMNKNIPLEHVTKEAGLLVKNFTELLNSFGKMKMTLEAYVCLKVITILHYTLPICENEEQNEKSKQIHTLYVEKVLLIQDQFVKALQIHLSQCENGPKLSEILNWQPMLEQASKVLLQSKMFYVPFLICKTPEKFVSLRINSTIDSVNQTLKNLNEFDENNQINDETDCDETEKASSTTS